MITALAQKSCWRERFSVQLHVTATDRLKPLRATVLKSNIINYSHYLWAVNLAKILPQGWMKLPPMIHTLCLFVGIVRLVRCHPSNLVFCIGWFYKSWVPGAVVHQEWLSNISEPRPRMIRARGRVSKLGHRNFYETWLNERVVWETIFLL